MLVHIKMCGCVAQIGDTLGHLQPISLSSFVTAKHKLTQIVQYTGKEED